MLIDVNPGIVFTSFKKIFPPFFSTKKSTRAIRSVPARETPPARTPESSSLVRLQFRRNQELRPSSRYFAA